MHTEHMRAHDVCMMLMHSWYSKESGPGFHLLGSLQEGIPFFSLSNAWVVIIRVTVPVVPRPRCFPESFMPSYNLTDSSIAQLDSLEQANNLVSPAEAKFTTYPIALSVVVLERLCRMFQQPLQRLSSGILHCSAKKLQIHIQGG